MGGPPVRAEPILRVQVAQIESSEPQVGRTSPKISSPNESRQHLIVTFPLATPDGVIAEVSRQHRMYAVHRIGSKILDRLVVLFHVGQRSDMAALIAALVADPRVSDVQTDKLYEALLSRQPPAIAQWRSDHRNPCSSERVSALRLPASPRSPRCAFPPPMSHS
jgi:hypothetical protein